MRKIEQGWYFAFGAWFMDVFLENAWVATCIALII